jgi:rubredoxin
MQKWVCTVCKYVYDPAVGDPDHGIPGGTPFEDLPEGWVCPVCLLGKEYFEPLKETTKKRKGTHKGGAS